MHGRRQIAWRRHQRKDSFWTSWLFDSVKDARGDQWVAGIMCRKSTRILQYFGNNCGRLEESLDLCGHGSSFSASSKRDWSTWQTAIRDGNHVYISLTPWYDDTMRLDEDKAGYTVRQRFIFCFVIVDGSAPPYRRCPALICDDELWDIQLVLLGE
jgi:hypothetical protein